MMIITEISQNTHQDLGVRVTEVSEELLCDNFHEWYKEIKKSCGDFKLPPEFEQRMKEYYDKGFTAGKALELFCENSNNEFEREILQLTN